ncbi:uncharacterized protein [Prorops nasuta]|uniref:uncharacterized protein isoform X3 n=1 Tax=Prorops nasuta TaxID=863751 RepID=UPI0034CF88FF
MTMIYLRLHVGWGLRYNTNARHLNVLIVPLFPLWIIGAFCVKDIAGRMAPPVQGGGGGTGKSVPISHIVALVGEATYLPCDISTSHEGDAVHLVLWYREDLGTSVYSVDARGRDFGIAERWSDDSVFSSRAYFMPDKKPAELGVDHIREEDAGIYRCRVDFQIGQTRNSRVNLTVIVPPRKIVIVDHTGIARNSLVGPYVEGDNLKLYCDVYGGKPAPSVSWYYNDKFVNNQTTTLRSGATRSIIEIKHLGRNDVRTELTCNATNNNRSIPLSSSVRVDMNFSPLNVRIDGANQPLSAGKRYDLVCTTSGSRPPARVTWYKDGQRLEDSKETTSGDGNTTTSVLSFMVTKADAGRHLTCRAENPIMETRRIEDDWTLEILYTPETQIQLGTSLNPDSIREGTDVYFDCLIRAEPPVYKVEWRHQGKTLHHNVTQGIIISNQSLVLQGVDRKSAGNYTCVGYNTEGDGESTPFYLNVMWRPDMVHNCTTSNTSTNSFSVTCTGGFNGGLTQSFLLEVRESNSQELRANMTSHTPSFSVTNLESGALYHACIYAFNDKGRSEAMVVQAGTLRLPEKQLTSESERPRQNIRLTPMLSVMIGVVTALIIIAVIVMVVLRIQHTHVDEQSKSHVEDSSKQTKTAPTIQRELRFREGSSLLTDEKHPGSPFRKLDSSGDLSESDEKNPDIIPQQITGDEPSEYLRKRRLVSTIETSPSRSLLTSSTQHPSGTPVGGHNHNSYVGYCTIRNGMPLRELSNISTKHKTMQPMVGDVYESGMCTLPRQHWPSNSIQSMTLTMSPPAPPVLYTGLGVVSRACPGGTMLAKDVDVRIPGQCCVQSQKDGTISTPIVISKRESSV